MSNVLSCDVRCAPRSLGEILDNEPHTHSLKIGLWGHRGVAVHQQHAYTSFYEHAGDIINRDPTFTPPVTHNLFFEFLLQGENEKRNTKNANENRKKYREPKLTKHEKYKGSGVLLGVTGELRCTNSPQHTPVSLLSF